MPPTTQTSAINGHGNVVVQIVGEGNTVSIAGARGLRLTSFESALFAQAPVDPKHAGQPGWTQSGRRETRILYPYNRASLPFRGREDIVGALKDWLREDAGVSVHALIGGGGRGKTRLAVEIAAWAREQGWTAGFARHEELSVFGTDGCRTDWNAPCLVVIDYASAKRVEIAAWLKALVHDEAERPPLRLLLLERTGGDGIAWWRKIFGQADATGEAVRDLLAQGAPATLEALATPEERHAVFAAAFGQAREKPRNAAKVSHPLKTSEQHLTMPIASTTQLAPRDRIPSPNTTPLQLSEPRVYKKDYKISASMLKRPLTQRETN